MLRNIGNVTPHGDRNSSTMESEVRAKSVGTEASRVKNILIDVQPVPVERRSLLPGSGRTFLIAR